MFSYLSPEQRVPADHPLRPIRQMVDEVLKELSPRFDRLYDQMGRPSIAPEKLLRALLLQILYSIRSERLLLEQLDYNLLFRWFVGLNMDDAVWVPTVFSENRDRLLEGAVAHAFFDAVLGKIRQRGWVSDEHFSVDGTLLEAWASQAAWACGICWAGTVSLRPVACWRRVWAVTPTKLYELLAATPPELILLAEVEYPQKIVQSRIRTYLRKYLPLRSKLPETELRELGVAPETARSQKILDLYFHAMLEGKVGTRSEQTKFLKKLVQGQK